MSDREPRLRGRELAAHLEQRRRERHDRQRSARAAAYGTGGAPAGPNTLDRSETDARLGAAPGSHDRTGGRRRRRNPRPAVVRGTLLVGALLGVLIVVTVLRAHDSVQLATSCTTPNFAVNVNTVSERGAVVYRITGPAGRYTINARPAGSNPAAAGATTADVGRALTPVRELKDCRARGAMPIHLQPGTYTLSLMRLDSPLTGPAPIRSLTVTAR